MAQESRGVAFSQLRRGVLEYCVMAALCDGERYGYELVATLGEILSSRSIRSWDGCARTAGSRRVGRNLRAARRGATTG